MTRFNKLSPAEEERLAILMEECAEVIQICGKILRHGYESHNPFDINKTTNRELLEKEIGDLVWATEFMCSKNDVTDSNISIAEQVKATKIKQYLHHQDI